MSAVAVKNYEKNQQWVHTLYWQYKQEKRDKENIENKSSENQEGKLLTLILKNVIINLTKKNKVEKQKRLKRLILIVCFN